MKKYTGLLFPACRLTIEPILLRVNFLVYAVVWYQQTDLGSGSLRPTFLLKYCWPLMDTVQWLYSLSSAYPPPPPTSSDWNNKDWSNDSRQLTPSQARRSYQGKTRVIKSKIKVWVTIDIIRHFILRGFGKMKTNEPRRQKLKRQNNAESWCSTCGYILTCSRLSRE